ncbi:radical SAM family heme chaperone HemW [Maritimibacter dapengensis]|uniref:Heme chaperone HemW n=1 Tax=Maritimibacter dapengensis TaxID=2836868 RepID=A0ABS6T5T0_9RHOB|nr:radical SAM family heme chaperone HemW [Maritimibacter dapengensis]MBV7380073.1 radical SAM family heme chaperone HemW [Maritimibacter dapengensis]
MTAEWRLGGFGLYVHWPFCAAKCPYCDFNSHVSSSIDQDSWLAAYLAEIDRVAAETPDRVLNSVYFGGGTPSLMEPRLVEAIIDRAVSHWTAANDIEITLEANPSSIEADRFAGYRASGVNRVSMGFQALNDRDLKALGRLHDVETALRALDVARQNFDRINFDLIYARQNQTLADWKGELERALSFDPDHLSLYQLTIEDGTAFGDRFARGRLKGLPDDDLGADMFFLTQDLTEAAGLPAYEVSNHARPGEESRHNFIYWSAGDYAGIGPGAHGRLTLDDIRYATWTELSPNKWLADITAGRGEAGRSRLSRQDQAAEYLMMGLRTTRGLDLERYSIIAGLPIDDNKIKDLTEIGLLRSDRDHLIATRDGRAVLNAVISDLLPDQTSAPSR